MDLEPPQPDEQRTEPGASPSTSSAPAQANEDGWARPLAFVLSGGGSYGAVQVGMAAALAESEIRPDLIVGSSVGALNGSVLAADPMRGHRHLAALWNDPSALAPFGAGRLRAALDFVRWRRSLCPPNRLAALIDERLDVDYFDELAVPLAVIATALGTGAATPLTTGPLATALLASSAIPGVFPPVEIEGAHYIDGGVAANVPVRQAVALGARSIIVLNATPSELSPVPPRSIVGAVVNASALMLRGQRAESLDGVGDEIQIVRLPRVTPPDLSSFDFSQGPELVQVATRRSREFLDNLPNRLGKPALLA